MRKILLPLLASIFVMACNTRTTQVANETPGKQDSQKIAFVKMAPGLEKLLTHFKDGSMPIVIDSVYMTKAEKGDSMDGNEVKILSKGWGKIDSIDMSEDNGFKEFYTIDSVKAKGAFAKWAEKLDIGMTKLSNAYALQKIKVDDTNTLLLWALVYSSYEADPVFDGTVVYGSLLKQNQVSNCFMLGEISEGADPPSEGQTLITSRLSKDKTLLFDESEMTIDLDDSAGACTVSHFNYLLNNGVPKFISKKSTHKEGIKVKE